MGVGGVLTRVLQKVRKDHEGKRAMWIIANASEAILCWRLTAFFFLSRFLFNAQFKAATRACLQVHFFLFCSVQMGHDFELRGIATNISGIGGIMNTFIYVYCGDYVSCSSDLCRMKKGS